MITREVTLQTGLTVGAGGRALTATIREETLGDELAVLESGVEGLRAHRAIMMRRVAKLGDLADPTPAILGKLTRTDWELIERAMMALDAEQARGAGLAPQAEARDGGREEPGGKAPGDA